MTTIVGKSQQTYYDAYGTKRTKSIADMSDQEFTQYKAESERNKARQEQLSGTTASSSTGTNTAANAATSLQQQAKDMASFQLENASKQMELSYGYRSKEKSQDDAITRGQSEQQYGFQRGLADQSYNNQRGINDQQNTQQSKMQDNQYGQERTMFNMRDSAQQRDTQSARNAANALYFGRSRNRRGFQGR